MKFKVDGISLSFREVVDSDVSFRSRGLFDFLSGLHQFIGMFAFYCVII